MEPQLKENAKSPELDAEETAELAPIKEALTKLQAAEARAKLGQAKLQEDVNRARDEYLNQVRLFNRDILRPCVLHSADEWRRYTEKLSRADFFRSCFVRHEGNPMSFPCMVVTVRAPSTAHEQIYNHRFISEKELESLLVELRQQ